MSEGNTALLCCLPGVTVTRAPWPPDLTRRASLAVGRGQELAVLAKLDQPLREPLGAMGTMSYLVKASDSVL